MYPSISKNKVSLLTLTSWALSMTGNLLAQDATFNSVTLPNAGPTQRLLISNTETAGTYPIRIFPQEAASTKFNFCVNAGVNPGDSRLNQVFRFGWNLGQGGQRIDSYDGAMGMEFENHYAPSGSERYFEQHLVYVNPANRIYRPLSWIFNKTTDNIGGMMVFDTFSFIKPSNNAQWLRFSPYQLELYGGTVVLFGQNNTPAFKQANAAGNSYVPLFQLNNLDQVTLGPWGNASTFAGNVGIKTTNITSTLTVNGSISSNTTRLNPQASAPAGTKGDLYTNSNGTLWFHNGTAWKQVVLQ